MTRVRIADGGTESAAGVSTRPACPVSLERALRRSRRRHGVDLHHDRAHRRRGQRRQREPGIAVGAPGTLPADGGTYTLYFLFPLDEQQDTMALVTRALLTAGALLLVLVAGVTWLVTRQVVTPVRMARRVAERLAAGQLEERLRVTRRGRRRAAGDVVQPDGLQPAAPDPPARGARAGSSAGSSPTSPTSCGPR